MLPIVSKRQPLCLFQAATELIAQLEAITSRERQIPISVIASHFGGELS
jgi:hypothetical protein